MLTACCNARGFIRSTRKDYVSQYSGKTYHGIYAVERCPEFILYWRQRRILDPVNRDGCAAAVKFHEEMRKRAAARPKETPMETFA